jgi:dienelactone hydrolase
MGAGVLAEVWPFRPNVRGILLLHGLAALPRGVRPGTPVHLHIAADDSFFPAAEVCAWEKQARAAGLSVDVFAYRDAGHYFIDSASPDYNEEAATMLWQRLLPF